MKRTPVYEFRQALPEHLAEVARGEPLTLTRRGRPIAEVVPVGTWENAGMALSGAFAAARAIREAIAALPDERVHVRTVHVTVTDGGDLRLSMQAPEVTIEQGEDGTTIHVPRGVLG